MTNINFKAKLNKHLIYIFLFLATTTIRKMTYRTPKWDKFKVIYGRVLKDRERKVNRI